MDSKIQISDEVYNEIVKSINNCEYKKVDICSLEVLPCSRCVESGKCETIINIIKKHRGLK